MGRSIQVNGVWRNEKVMELKYGLMGQDMREIGRTIRQMEKEFSITRTVMSTMENGETTKPMAKVFTLMLMELLIMGTGLMISRMALELKHGQMAQNTKEITGKARNMEKAN